MKSPLQLYRDSAAWWKNELSTELKRARWAWTFTDWANSAYVTTVTGVFLGPYLTELVKEEACSQYSNCSWCDVASACLNSIDACSADACPADLNNSGWCCSSPGTVDVAGVGIAFGSYYSFAVTVSVIVQILFLPFLGAAADLTRYPLKFLMGATVFGAITTVLLVFVSRPNLWWLGGLLLVLSNVAMGANCTFYDSFLNIIVKPEERDDWSSRGFAIGYIGGGLLLVVNLIMYELDGSFLMVRIIFVTAGVWWLAFTFIPFKYLWKYQSLENAWEEDEPSSLDKMESVPPPTEIRGNYCTIGLKQFADAFRLLRKLPYSLLFLISAMIYNDGIQTVISLSSVFATQALGFTSGQVAIIFLIVQFVAFFGAFIFVKIADVIKTKWAILLSLLIWCGVLVWVYFTPSQAMFYGEAVVIATVLGGSQALSRGLFARLIPSGAESELFSFYEVTQRGTSWMGPLVYGVVVARYNNDPRPGILVLLVFFVVGSALLLFVDVERGLEMAKELDEQRQIGQKSDLNKTAADIPVSDGNADPILVEANSNNSS